MSFPVSVGLRLLLVDDHAVVRTGFRRLLEQAGPSWQVCEAESGEQAYVLFAAGDFDVVVLDLSLPGMSGLETLRRLRRRAGNARVLVFSMHDQGVFVEQALAAGAQGYITKSSAPQVLVDAVLAVAAGERYLHEGLALALEQDTAGGESALRNLSAREFEIFRLLAEGRCTHGIAALLNISYKTVANHACSIKDKLGLSNAADLTRLAIREGVVDA
ncbi:DNA-binding response regulator [Alkalilimnicola ehrlichii]|uniref:DNA-binding response regulator n=1 Tax=Alkalilimnicola ehrlichii TaxID=351052 RepID=A0A3E0WLY5_9GAMM|nr:response regulator transcription factor [Alkalilimnicola ehrlichii]RFA25848.1 DNA-binding response regulator [Alkalilimnicola ehrlichii]RFA33097.1 DNA-binding response regulator [Alkalilimnicola ehrlichii]